MSFPCRISESRIRCLAPCYSSRKYIRQRENLTMLIFELWYFAPEMFRISMFPKQLIDHTFVFLGLRGVANFPSSRVISKARILRISEAYLPFSIVELLIQ